MNREAAREYLAMLASELLSGACNYFLPLEAVESVQAARREGKDDLIAEQIEKARDAIHKEKHYCSSDSGPIRKTIAHEFEPPPMDQVTDIIDQRFGPIAGIFTA
jgi:hypothetical protein